MPCTIPTADNWELSGLQVQDEATVWATPQTCAVLGLCSLFSLSAGPQVTCRRAPPAARVSQALTLAANRRAHRVSWCEAGSGLMLQIIMVLPLPPRQGCTPADLQDCTSVTAAAAGVVHAAAARLLARAPQDCAVQADSERVIALAHCLIQGCRRLCRLLKKLHRQICQAAGADAIFAQYWVSGAATR